MLLRFFFKKKAYIACVFLRLASPARVCVCVCVHVALVSAVSAVHPKARGDVQHLESRKRWVRGRVCVWRPQSSGDGPIYRRSQDALAHHSLWGRYVPCVECVRVRVRVCVRV